ncbi:TonB-dependent receptor family protein [Pollutibacter soli]|uniref:TonB-dependent receptor family protein n=1 Tax=Pollutibacter soli TaxID=3034157 RepID=UPI003013ED93
MKNLILTIVILVAIATPLAAQVDKASLSANVKDAETKAPLPFASITLLKKDSSFVAGTITDDNGIFAINEVKSQMDYILLITLTGYQKHYSSVVVGQLTNILHLGNIFLSQDTKLLKEVKIVSNTETVSPAMDKKTYSVADNISAAGGSILDMMKSLPGVTTQDGKVQLRGSERVMVLIDGKQTALTGFGNQSSLENIPASAIERIEIINNPSSKYDANGNAGIINIIYKKERKDGFNGRAGLTAGVGALWVKKENYPTIDEQYQATPKINPSISLNYRKKKTNFFLQADDLYTKTLNKNEFVERFYGNGDTVYQQTRRNRTTNIVTAKTGVDWQINKSNTLNISTLFSSEKILDRGEEPFFGPALKERLRLWQFLEDELKTTVTANASWLHKFKEPGRILSASFSYTFHRENEKYFFTDIMPTYTGLDSFKLISDEHVADVSIDYLQPLKSGKFETGVKFRRRYIPTDMQFKPGLNSPLDTTADGWANYGETIPAVYGNYLFENRLFEVEAGLRFEYVNVEYDVNPGHPVYKSSRYNYIQPFPNLRIAYKLNENNRLTAFYNRRVDRPNEVDIRIFPKYDDVEIIKVGNPELRPQFTDNVELGYKTNWKTGFLSSAVFFKAMNATITRIATIVPPENLIYNVFQNAGRSRNFGMEVILSQSIGKWSTWNLGLTGYKSVIDSFTIVNKYPVESVYSAPRQELISGNIKLNGLFKLKEDFDAQIAFTYLAPDLIPQGKVYSRFSIDLGFRKKIQKGNGEIFLNATDIANTFRLRKSIKGNGFTFVSTDYYETQVFRLGYNYRF